MTWQVHLLKTAADSAKDAARARNGTFETKLQAYRLWVVTTYMHQVKRKVVKSIIFVDLLK